MYDNLNGAKLAAKRIQSHLDIKRSQAQEILARVVGFRDWHHLTIKLSDPPLFQFREEREAKVLEYAARHGFAGKIDQVILLLIANPSGEKSSNQDLARATAQHAASALQVPDRALFERRIETALSIDPMCAEALILKAGNQPTMDERIPVYREAILSALRTEHGMSADKAEALLNGVSPANLPSTSASATVIPPNDLLADSPLYNPGKSTRSLERGWFCLGEAYLRSGYPDRAISAFQQIHEEYCSFVPAHSTLWLAVSHLASGNLERSRAYASDYDYPAYAKAWQPILQTICDIADVNEDPTVSHSEEWDEFEPLLLKMLEGGRQPGRDLQPFQSELWHIARAISHAVLLNPALRKAYFE